MDTFDLSVWDAALAAFLASPGNRDWLAPWAREAKCLPIYVDWTHVLGINRSGEIISHQHEQWPGKELEADHVVADVRLINVALHEGRKEHPWLTTLLPGRPADAQACSMCRGAPLPVNLVCYCGGAGWVPAEDTWVNRDRLRK